MHSDSIFNAPVPALSKEHGKKKRTNKMAKLKQSKLDVRREQWLSQVKNKGGKLEPNRTSESLPSSVRVTGNDSGSVDSFEMRAKREENEGLGIHDSDLESVMSTSVGSSLGHNASRKSLSSSSSSISSFCSSGSVTEEEENDECLDDWEAFADALNVESHQHNKLSVSPNHPEARDASTVSASSDKNLGLTILKTQSRVMEPRTRINSQAWRPDDAFRPQSLPSILKQNVSTLCPGWQCSRGSWSWKSTVSQPCSCPICCEDLDVTDSSFLPCSCGFQLCLFCYKRILEADARCPGCRKRYGPMVEDLSFDGAP